MAHTGRYIRGFLEQKRLQGAGMGALRSPQERLLTPAKRPQPLPGRLISLAVRFLLPRVRGRTQLWSSRPCSGPTVPAPPCRTDCIARAAACPFWGAAY